jgi:uncharacterized membrane protein YcaP (DUF421 family)
MLHDLAHLGVSAPEKIVRTISVYLAILLLIHLAGKRSLAQLNSFDLVVLLLLSNVVQNAIIGNDNSLLGGLLGAVVLITANFLIVRLAFMHPRFGKALQGGSTTLYDHGKLDARALRREAITEMELVDAVRRQGFSGLDEVEHVELEPEGMFNATPKPKPGIEDVLRRLDDLERKLEPDQRP